MALQTRRSGGGSYTVLEKTRGHLKKPAGSRVGSQNGIPRGIPWDLARVVCGKREKQIKGIIRRKTLAKRKVLNQRKRID